MNIFIDESGNFTWADDGSHAISAVGALIIPDRAMNPIKMGYARLRAQLPKEKGEVKGRLLSEDQVSAVVSLLAREQVLLEITATDMSMSETADVESHRKQQAENLTARLTPRHHPNVRAAVEDLRHRLENLSLQLYVQSTVTFELIDRILRQPTMFYSQRLPKELAAFHWVVDGKDRTRITDWEAWWSVVILGLLQTKSIDDPMPVFEGGDYSYLKRYEAKMPDFLKSQIKSPSIEDDSAYSLKMLLTESFRFSSNPEPGLELVDILVNATRRALVGSLRVEGWKDIPRLMIHLPERHYIQFVVLHTRPLAPRVPYQPVLDHFMQGGKQMLLPHFYR